MAQNRQNRLENLAGTDFPYNFNKDADDYHLDSPFLRFAEQGVYIIKNINHTKAIAVGNIFRVHDCGCYCYTRFRLGTVRRMVRPCIQCFAIAFQYDNNLYKSANPAKLINIHL